jgi:hypothetical protein
MRIDHIAGMAVEQLFGRMFRRALVAVAMAVFVIVAVYQGSVAATLALQVHYGALNAHLILCAAYAVLALAAWFIFWRMGHKPAGAATTPALAHPREMQMAMLVEAVMLGYALARKSDRTH